MGKVGRVWCDWCMDYFHSVPSCSKYEAPKPAAPAGDQERFEAEAEVAGAYAGSARLTKPEADGKKAREFWIYETNGPHMKGKTLRATAAPPRNPNCAVIAHVRRVDPRMVEIDREDISAVIATIERRMRSDDACDRPFDEDLAEALALLRTVKQGRG